ncbi:hypothetical protein [Arthrospiribacter ruber]|uniref:Uncharacterized protein n=1 Tax=Arthrospiribacter ruber TaxID=2487934 RepID=A0A951IVB0_9BACT|nr:hypothetical protein [Arthrospiribacter ruber]MBW3466667.1 hypothetical protein [Arthrospiribacter ruber]
MKTIGIILLLCGLVMIFIPGISFKTSESLIDAGPIQVNKKKNHQIEWPDYAGVLAITSGIILILVSKKK